MSEIFNKAVEQADKLSTQDNARAVLDELYGKFEERPIFKQGGQIATGLAGLGENIVYRQDGGEIDEAQFDYTGADIVGGAFTDYAGVERGGFADVPIGVDPG